MKRVVGVADMAISGLPGEMLVTYSLGSCIGVVIYDPIVKVGGMLHYMLPDSTMDSEKAGKMPAMFADTGIPLLFKQSYQLGAKKANLIVKIFGGAQILDEDGVFNMGKRNYLALRKIFWKNNVVISAEHVGGSINRTVRLEISTGRFLLKVPNSDEMEV